MKPNSGCLAIVFRIELRVPALRSAHNEPDPDWPDHWVRITTSATLFLFSLPSNLFTLHTLSVTICFDAHAS